MSPIIGYSGGGNGGVEAVFCPGRIQSGRIRAFGAGSVRPCGPALHAPTPGRHPAAVRRRRRIRGLFRREGEVFSE
ncbi:hypothetical protein [Methanofollis fontis]|uniref:hypothetical protein n=1 Tax=Methanofollis fontis TaxID=2052832 RepID=UPI00102F1F29|nr:hypothetical protein [Methanofollis fontis]